ncbi:MAG: cell division protein FtsZ [Synergistaceae bacterium]|jgi:cell division protein FtsZ|nr:cell division protein FtsZ [Synergistaceae bacterium]
MDQQEQVFHIPDTFKQREHILVVGVGGGGGNALNHIIESGVEGVEFVAANTDARALSMNLAPHKIVLGEKLTGGRGAGANPQVGMDAARESIDRIREYVTGADMVFVTAGMGGGTGTGAAPIIAEVAKELGALVVGVVTTPFSFEMKKRFKVAQEGIAKLKEKVDALLVVENDNLMKIATDQTKSTDAYKMADEVLRQAVQGVTDLILHPGNINLDFADIKTVMENSGTAIMGIGTAEGENRAEQAAKNAIKSPLMSISMKGARGVLFNITTGPDATLFEMQHAAEIITATADKEAQAIWGHCISEDLGNAIRITVIATGFVDTKESRSSAPDSRENPGKDDAPGTGGGYRLRPGNNTNFTFEEADLAPPSNEDMFNGLPKTAYTPYDKPAILRKRQK